MRLNRLMRKGFGGSVAEHTRKREDMPLMTTQRMLQCGVAAEQIDFTGFPLPQENVFGSHCDPLIMT
jgi:hypothetical protein